MVRLATLVALGEIAWDAKTARVRFGDDGVEHQVGVKGRRFRNGGFLAMLVCPRCGGGSGPASSARRPACLWQGERVDLSFASVSTHVRGERCEGISAIGPQGTIIARPASSSG